MSKLGEKESKKGKKRIIYLTRQYVMHVANGILMIRLVAQYAC